MSADAPRRSGSDIAAPLLEVLRDRLALPSLTYAEPPETLGDGVTARAYAFRLGRAEGESGAGPLVCRIFQGGFGEGDQTAVENALHNALADHGFSAPRVLASGDETSPLGAPFMVMERVEGRNAFGPLLLALGAAALALLLGHPLPILLVVLAYWSTMTRLLTRLHAVPGEAVVAAFEGRGISRERLTLARYLRNFEIRANAEALAGLRPVVDWLIAHQPPPAASPVVCHGDFWFGNVMISLKNRRIVLLDWTQACLGHPELDLGWMSIQHFSRLPLEQPVNEAVYAFVTELLRPGAWMLMSANRLAYRLVRPVDAQRLHYFTVFAAARALFEVATERATFAARPGSAPPAILAAWGSPRTVSLLLGKVRTLTGIQLTL